MSYTLGIGDSDMENTFKNLWTTCDNCNGSGRDEDDGCEYCYGAGKVPTESARLLLDFLYENELKYRDEQIAALERRISALEASTRM